MPVAYRGGVDPAPDRDLPSDIRFRLWLQELTPEQVAKDREPVHGAVMEKWVADVRARRVTYNNHRK